MSGNPTLEQFEAMMTTTEAGAIIGITSTMVCNLIRQGDIKAHRLGGMWLIEPHEVAAYRSYRQAVLKNREEMRLAAVEEKREKMQRTLRRISATSKEERLQSLEDIMKRIGMTDKDLGITD